MVGIIHLVNNVVGGTVFTEGAHYSLVNNVRGDILWGDTAHYDNGNNTP